MRKIFVVDWSGGEISSHLISACIRDYFRTGGIPEGNLAVEDVTCQATLDALEQIRIATDFFPKERMANYFAKPGSGGVIFPQNATENIPYIIPPNCKEIKPSK
jgi:hypothetical protein